MFHQVCLFLFSSGSTRLSHESTQHPYHMKSLSDLPFWATSYASKEELKNQQPTNKIKESNKLEGNKNW